MELLNNFSLNKPYRFCIYLASVILVVSFLNEPSGINIPKLRSDCFWLIVFGLAAWMVDNYLYDVLFNETDGGSMFYSSSYNNYQNSMLVVNGFYLIVGFATILI